MLGLSLYFIRPLLPDWGMQVLSLLLGLAFIIYALYQFFWKKGSYSGFMRSYFYW